MRNVFHRVETSSRRVTPSLFGRRLLLTAATAAMLVGCGKNHKEDPFQGTWFAAQSDGRDHGPMRAIEFKPKDKTTGDVVLTPMYSREQPMTGTYERVGENQVKLMNPAHPNDPLVLTATVDVTADTVTVSGSQFGTQNMQFRWLKSGETLADAIKADEAVVKQKDDAEQAKRDAQQKAAMADQQARMDQQNKRQQTRLDKCAAELKQPDVVLVEANTGNMGKPSGFAFDLKPVAPTAGTNAGKGGFSLTSFAGTVWVANEAGAMTTAVTVTPNNDGSFRVNFAAPKAGEGVGAYQSGSGPTDLRPNPEQQVPPGVSPEVADNPAIAMPVQLSTAMYLNGRQATFVINSDHALHDKIVQQYATTLARATRDASIAWWFDYNHGRSRLSADQRAKVVAANKQIEQKYGPENLLTPQQRQDRANESADLIAAVFTPNELADTPDCRAMQDYWEQAGYINGGMPADNAALIDQVLQRTRDLTVFLAPAHKSAVPAGADQWLIGQRRDWARQNADFEFVTTPAIMAAAQARRGNVPRFIVVAERAKVSSTGDRALLWSDGVVESIPADAAQAALDDQAKPATP